MSRNTPPELAISAVLRHVRVTALQEASDSTLLARFIAERDDLAFEALMRRHGGPVFRLCRRLLVTREDAEDAFQAVFLVFARKAATLPEGANLRQWLLGVAYRVAKKAQVRAARGRLVLADADETLSGVPDPTHSPDHPLGVKEVTAVLEEEIRNLPERLRDAFELCHRLDHTREDAARTLGCSLPTLQRRLRDARSILRRQLQGRLQPEGIPLATALALGGLASREAVPPDLIRRAVENALAVGLPGGPAPPAAVALLAGGELTASGARLGRLLAVSILCLALGGTGIWLCARPCHSQTPPAKAEAEQVAAPDEGPPAPIQSAAKDPERLLHDEVVPRVLAILEATGGMAELRGAHIDRQTRTAHVLIDWHVEPLDKGLIHVRYGLADGEWELWTNLYHGGDPHPVDPEKPIILGRFFGYQLSLKLDAIEDLRGAFAVLGPS